MTQLFGFNLFMLTLSTGLDVCFAPTFVFKVHTHTHTHTDRVISEDWYKHNTTFGNFSKCLPTLAQCSQILFNEDKCRKTGKQRM